MPPTFDELMFVVLLVQDRKDNVVQTTRDWELPEKGITSGKEMTYNIPRGNPSAAENGLPLDVL